MVQNLSKHAYVSNTTKKQNYYDGNLYFTIWNFFTAINTMQLHSRTDKPGHNLTQHSSSQPNILKVKVKVVSVFA